jgi:2-dehydro-3-deoxy-D-arabinonate dehydratase
MKLYRTLEGPVVELNGAYHLTITKDWDELINSENLFKTLEQVIANTSSQDSLSEVCEHSLAPLISQEVWAAGVTYLRSKNARMDEAKEAGGGDFYDRVYEAERPEIFFKATAARTVGHNAYIRIRKDSNWNVPEPELTLFVNKNKQIAGYTIGNDVSSRDIEGENPLYLPQAKSYQKSAALGPCLAVFEEPINPNTQISLTIERGGKVAFHQAIQLNQMKRKLADLVEYLTRECDFPTGCFLMTGTGIVPPDHFTLASQDKVSIEIEGIGILINTVE